MKLQYGDTAPGFYVPTLRAYQAQWQPAQRRPAFKRDPATSPNVDFASLLRPSDPMAAPRHEACAPFYSMCDDCLMVPHGALMSSASSGRGFAQ